MIGGKTFYTGHFNGIPTVVVFSGWGKVASASTASILLSHFKIDSLVFMGVAGAANTSLNIGDVVVSTQAYQHDMDATPMMPQYQVPSVNKTFFDADVALIDLATGCIEEFLSTLDDSIEDTRLNEFAVSSPKLVKGVIASGDTFVNSESDLANLHPDIITQAVEMEGAAVAQVAESFDVPFVVVRTISDKANGEAHLDFAKFVETVASVYSFEILTRMSKIMRLRTEPEGQPHVLPQSCQELIELLGLERHIEGGYFKETHRSSQQVIVKRGGHDSVESAGTSIQFLLNKDEGGFSAWHQIEDDETWYYQGGQPMLVHYLDQNKQLITTLLGDPLGHPGSTNQLTVPRNHWFSAEVGAKNGFSLVACSVSPAFDFKRFKLADREQMLLEFPQHQDIIIRLSIPSLETNTT